MTFEESLRRLEEIVSRLEGGDASLEDSLALFEEGTKLVSTCTAQLQTAEQRVTKVVRGADGAPQETPLESEG